MTDFSYYCNWWKITGVFTASERRHTVFWVQSLLVLVVFYCFCQSIRSSAMNQLTTQPPWVYCEIARDIGVKIRKEGKRQYCALCLLLLSEGRQGLVPRVGEGANPKVLFLPATTCAKLVVSSFRFSGVFSHVMTYSLLKLIRTVV